jgi:phage shock protein A
MPIPWSSIASAIPWSDVINRAPDVLREAKKVWQRIGRKAAAGSAARPLAGATPEERVAALETRCRDLETRLQESTDVLAQIAEQQSGLIAEVARLQRRNRWLYVVAVVALALGVTALLLH